MSMAVDKERVMLRERLGSVRFPVHIICAARSADCPASRKVHEMLMELRLYSPLMTVESLTADENPARIAELGIELLPATVIKTEHGNGIRLYGVPEGYEFATLIEALEMVGTRRIDIRHDVLQKVKEITVPVHLRVFVKSSCPYSPSAVMTAHRLAMANPLISADMIEAAQFPEFADRFAVHGVPRVVINNDYAFEGSLPEDLYVDEVLQAIEQSTALHHHTDL